RPPPRPASSATVTTNATIATMASNTDKARRIGLAVAWRDPAYTSQMRPAWQALHKATDRRYLCQACDGRGYLAGTSGRDIWPGHLAGTSRCGRRVQHQAQDWLAGGARRGYRSRKALPVDGPAEPALWRSASNDDAVIPKATATAGEWIRSSRLQPGECQSCFLKERTLAHMQR